MYVKGVKDDNIYKCFQGTGYMGYVYMGTVNVLISSLISHRPCFPKQVTLYHMLHINYRKEGEWEEFVL